MRGQIRTVQDTWTAQNFYCFVFVLKTFEVCPVIFFFGYGTGGIFCIFFRFLLQRITLFLFFLVFNLTVLITTTIITAVTNNDSSVDPTKRPKLSG